MLDLGITDADAVAARRVGDRAQDMTRPLHRGL
jgi:hypothetical protein